MERGFIDDTSDVAIMVGTTEKHKTRPWARAWSELDSRTIICRQARPGLAIIAHEVDHILRNGGNERHAGHWWHFCARSWHMLRFWLGHVDQDVLDVARRLHKLVHE